MVINRGAIGSLSTGNVLRESQDYATSGDLTPTAPETAGAERLADGIDWYDYRSRNMVT